MDRMSDSGSEGCGFESRRGHKTVWSVSFESAYRQAGRSLPSLPEADLDDMKKTHTKNYVVSQNLYSNSH
jgi:hypothetical protein